jgi:NAD-reducing hydrogenase large subunit
MASAKAGDALLGVPIPATAEKLRRMMNLGQVLQSHALSFFYLSAPDMLLGWDSNPLTRNVVGLVQADPELARKGIRLRQFGQEVIEVLGGKRIHPAWAVPGGVRSGLEEEGRQHLLNWIPEAYDTAAKALAIIKQYVSTHEEEIHAFGEFPSLYLGLVGANGEWENYGGALRVVNSKGEIVADKIPASRYQEFIGEAVEDHSYLKFPYFKPLGYPGGIYRVGPLARLNICETMGYPKAEKELQEYRSRFGRTVSSSFLYHYARLIEMLVAIEILEDLLNDPEITGTNLRANAGINYLEGVGVSEAPRGTLFHHYQIDKDGLITKVNLIIATGQNNLPMNRTVNEIAKHYIKAGNVSEGMLNRIEAGIRCFDPCLSCSTHAVGQMPMAVRVVDASGGLVKELIRS